MNFKSSSNNRKKGNFTDKERKEKKTVALNLE